MKTNVSVLFAAALFTGLWPAAADSRSSRHYHVVAESFGAAGQTVASAHCAQHGTLGGIGGSARRAREREFVSSQPGFLGASFQIDSLALIPELESVAENRSVRLAVIATLDDESTLMLDGDDVDWSPSLGPIQSVALDGTADVGAVFADTSARILAALYNWEGALGLTVLNVNPDDFEPYAGDGLPDDWQVQYFGRQNSSDAGPTADPDEDGQDNAFESQAGTDPTDGQSRFQLAIARATEAPNRCLILFQPVRADRVYTVQAKTDLAQPEFWDLKEWIEVDLDGMRAVTDLDGGDPVKFYRIKITMP